MDVFEKSLTDVFVANVSAGGATTTADLPAGAVGVQDASGALVTTLVAATTPVRIVSKSNTGVLSFSEFFTPSDIVTKISATYSAPVEQVSYLGWNGTTGNLDAVASQGYVLRIILDYTQRNIGTAPAIKSLGAYTVNASAQELATNLFDTFASEFGIGRLAAGSIVADRVGNGTYTNTTGWTCVSGSAVITKTGHGITPAAGTAIRLKASATDATSSLYFVVSYATNTITLDRAVTSSAFTNMGYASVAPTSFGLKFTGQAISPWNPRTDVHNKVYFTLGFTKEDGSSSIAPITYTTGISYGNGSYKEVANKELYGYMNKRGGAPYADAYGAPVINLQATYGNTYTYTDISIQQTPATFVGTGQKPVVSARILVAHKVGIDSIATFTTVFAL